MKKEIAVLVLNYNGKHFLKDCLSSVLDQIGVGFDVFLIDNASSDGSVEFVKKNFPQVKIIQNKENIGFTGGNNAGIKRAIGKYVYLAFLNNDTKVPRDWLGELLKSVRRSDQIGIATSVILDSKGEVIDSAGGCFVSFLTGTNAGLFCNQKYKDFDLIKDFPIFYASGCSFLVKSQVLQKIGLFEEDYFIYWEDIDLSWRALMCGYKVVCSVNSKVYHYGSGTMKGTPHSFYLAERNRLLTYFKNLSSFNLLWIFPILMLTRLIYSVLFFDGPAYFIAKIQGILCALTWSPRYFKKRNKIQKQRILSDYKVFQSNPIALSSLKTLVKMVWRRWSL